ncbi:MAG: thymidine phosphorylase [Candidatus Roizmanbacteria bacterium]|nr:MAG: thymidine phosphorylase [Candidatus Roizmanbacteria bacterium]
MNPAVNTKHHLEAIKAIQNKLLGKKLTYREVFNLMNEISHKRLSDILTTYFVAASFKEGFSTEELVYLTRAMVETGTKLNFKGIVADKHSTGGVAGTRTTMIIVPIIAAAGFKIPKTSSRAITTPAGTADVMELLGNVMISERKIESIVNDIGGCIVWGGHLGIAPADDIIIKIEEPLSFESFDKVIVSIMAKKVAASTNHLILDIPVGKTMKIRHFEDAEKVAKKFRMIGKHFDMEVITDISETFEPAGRGVGPYLEAKDVLEVLEQKKDRPLKLEAKALRLAGKLLTICFKDAHINKSGEEEARRILSERIALKKFKEIIKAQGGDDQVTSDNFKTKAHKKEVLPKKNGTIKEINNYNLNSVAKILGAPEDKYAGIYLLKKVDEKVEKKEPLLLFYSQDRYRIKEAEVTLQNMPIYEID